MKIIEYDDYIEILDPENFNVKETLECGQVFRFKKQDFGYTVYSLDHKADIYCQETIKIFTKDKKYFMNYFDFSTDYDTIKLGLSEYPMLKSAVNFGSGIRILRNNPLEMVIEFLISQNNNIPRIKTIIEKICEAYGKDMGDYYAFPTLEELKSIPFEFFKNIKCGYRDRYLYDSIAKISSGEVDLDSLYQMPTDEARAILMKLTGVGRKVADCILLFGYHKTDVFPTDTWVVKAYNRIYGLDEHDAIKISKHFVELFGDLSGYAQQYLFYQIRENN